MIKQVFSHGALYTLPSIFKKGAGFLAFPIYARILNPDEFGLLDLLLAVGAIVNVTIALEITSSVGRFYSQAKNKEEKILISSTAFLFSIAVYLFFCLLLSQTTFENWRLFNFQPTQSIIIVFSSYLFFAGCANFIDNQLRWQLMALRYAVLSTMMSLITIATTLFLMLFLDLRILSVLYGMLVGNIFFSIIGILLVRNSLRLRFSFRYLRKMLKHSIPLVASACFVWVSMFIDRWMISSMLGISEVGLYGVGQRIASVASLLTVGLSSGLMPIIYRKYKEEDTPRDIANIFLIYCGLALTIVLGSSLFSKEIVVLLASEKYLLSHSILPLVCSTIFFAQMYIFTPGLFLNGKTDRVLLINVLGALTNIVLNFVLIGYLGLIGAALATLLSSICVFILFIYFSQKVYPVPLNLSKIIVITCLVVPIILIKYYLEAKETSDLMIKVIVFIFMIILTGKLLLDRFKHLSLTRFIPEPSKD